MSENAKQMKNKKNKTNNVPRNLFMDSKTLDLYFFICWKNCVFSSFDH